MLASVAIPGWGVVASIAAIFGVLVAAQGDNAISRVFRGAATRKITEASSNAAVALVARVDQLEKEAERRDARISGLEEENRLLKELVTNAAKVDALVKKLDDHHAAILTAIGKIGGQS